MTLHPIPAAPGLPTHTATRYVVPLREGGSLPAVVEVETGELYVVKFRGAGQREPALVAELVVGLLAARLGLPVPDHAVVDLDPAFGRTERDPEIRDLLRASSGLNLGVRYLDGAFNYDPLAAAGLVPPDLAADVVWLDAYVTNVDRTARNPNILIWRGTPWLIDHGAALYFHHDWPNMDAERARAPFTRIADHVLLPIAGEVAGADARLAARLDPAVIASILSVIPDAWLLPPDAPGRAMFGSPDAVRDAYLDYLARRLAPERAFVREAVAAQARLAGAADG